MGIEQQQDATEKPVRVRGSRKLVVLIVTIALLVDNMLLTVVGKFRTIFVNIISINYIFLNAVPIVPEYLARQANGSFHPAAFSLDLETPRSLPIKSAQSVVTVADDDKVKEEEEEEKSLSEEMGFEVGIMFASKAVVQLMTSPFVGPITSRVGYGIPMFVGFIILTFSTLCEFGVYCNFAVVSLL